MHHIHSHTRVVVAMSGGVDSAVAAYLLANDGYDVLGVTMRLWSDTDPDTAGHRGCCSLDDIEDARRAAATLGIPHYVLDVRREFRRHVMDYFVSEYRKGRTPHPCIACNDRIKFGFLLRRAAALGAEFVATGHYARTAYEDGAYRLLRGIDMSKDQSYVLFGLGQDELRRVLFPVGEYAKASIRALAQQAGLHLADKADSQEICFVPTGDYREFLRKEVVPQPGELVDTRGRVIGEHNGIEFFTIGQRRGIGVATGERLFVTRIEPISRRVVLGSEADLLAQSVSVGAVRYTSGHPPYGPTRVHAKVRYSTHPLLGTLEPDNDTAVFRFDAPQRALTPGQAAVFYDGDEVIGGGYIESAHD